jgi:uncharacterized membrane protein YfcA
MAASGANITLGVAATGLVAGVLSGLLGVGGGIIMVSLLVMIAGYRQHNAHATSLAAIIPIAAAGAARFAAADTIDYRIAVLLAAGTLVGAPLGARLLARTRETSLKLLFGLLMMAVAVQLLWP